MTYKRFFASLVAVVTLLSGCASSPVAMRPESTAQINSVALIRVSEPAAYVANDFGNPGMMFGAVGGAVAGASADSAGNRLAGVIKDSGFTAGEELTQSLQDRLTAAGYQVRVVTAEREKTGKLMKDYDKVDATGADAILDVAIESIGYATEHPMFSPFWRPAAVVYVALVDARTHEKLYGEKFMYGYHNPLMSGTDLDSPDQFHFKDKDSLFADSTKVVDGMQDSLNAVTLKVAGNLAK